MRPAITGWFASFSTLEKPRDNSPTHYDHSDQRFASGTYDPSSQYRAAKVVEFFEEQGLTKEILRDQYVQKVELLKKHFLDKDFDPSVIRLTHDKSIAEHNGGFLSLTSPKAREIRAELLARDVFTDARDQMLRFGPAPYTTTTQIEDVMVALDEIVDTL